jgi:SAM-dependent methyltransferase
MRILMMKNFYWLSFTLTLLFIGTASCQQREQNNDSELSGRYIQQSPNRDGIGKIYMGREISYVMGHQGINWLERDSRKREEKPNQAIEALELKPTSVVADIGAGSGYFTFRISEEVPNGKVLAVDIQPEMIEFLEKKKKRLEATNVETILCTETDPKLPAESVDLALFVDVYHEIAFPYEYMQALVKGLKPGGRVALVEYRAEDPAVPIKRLHKMTEEQARKEMAVAGLEFIKNSNVLPQQHILLFRKPEQ